MLIVLSIISFIIAFNQLILFIPVVAVIILINSWIWWELKKRRGSRETFSQAVYKTFFLILVTSIIVNVYLFVKSSFILDEPSGLVRDVLFLLGAMLLLKYFSGIMYKDKLSDYEILKMSLEARVYSILVMAIIFLFIAAILSILSHILLKS